MCCCGRNEAKIKSLKEMKRQLIEQKQRQDEKLTKFKHQMVRARRTYAMCSSVNFGRCVSLQLSVDVAF